MAFSQEGAERVAALGFTCIELPISWGLPPELEGNHLSLFQSAVQHYHRAGVQVYGWLPIATCIPRGSYATQAWYALDPYGQRIPNQRGYYFTALLNPIWQTVITEKIQQLTESNADGLIMGGYTAGGTGLLWRGIPLGPIGSYDAISQEQYAQVFNHMAIPTTFSSKDPASQQYLKWRISTATQVIQQWAETARHQNPALVVQLGVPDAIAANHYLISGLDLDVLPDVDIVIEPPIWSHHPPESAIITPTISISASHTRLASVIPIYGGERMGSAREFQRNLSEAVALNTSARIQGMGYYYKNTLTGLLHSRYKPQHEALQTFNLWLDQQHNWLHSRTNASPLAVYYPYEATHWQWNPTSQQFIAICQTLLLNGYPLRVVGDDKAWDDVRVLVVPSGSVVGLDERLTQFIAQGGRIIAVGQKRLKQSPLWRDWRPQRLKPPIWHWLHGRIQRVFIVARRGYQRYRWVRRGISYLNKRRPQSVSMPPPALQGELIKAIGETFTPRLESDSPALLTIWREPDGTQQWHIVNYNEAEQRITLHLGDLTHGEVYTPGTLSPPASVVGSSLIFTVDSAKIVRSKG
ncbi:MAG: hypothetical protein H6673_01950 [Anaerolineales bacterium]|nr:hypothetical protein [Anaerolineales bacterium]